MEQINLSDELIWFTEDDFIRGKTLDGKIAYLDALYESFDNDKSNLQEILKKIPGSFHNEFTLFQPEEAISFPSDNTDNFLKGRTGKEAVIQHGLNQFEITLLMALAWQAKGLQWQQVNDGVTIHPYGWIRIIDTDIMTAVYSLAKKLINMELHLIEIAETNWFRIRLTPENIYFSDSFFDLDFKEEGAYNFVNLTAPTFTSLVGKSSVINEKLQPSSKVYKNLSLLHQKKQVPEYEQESLEKQVRRDLEKTTKIFGLRKIIRGENKVFRLFTNL